MPMRQEAFYPSCGYGDIRYCRWVPEETPRGIIQILHGIAEHVERYDDFAHFLASKGFLVVAEDHMGHGKSISKDGVRGYFYGGWFSAVADSHKLYEITRTEFPETPYILFGHSMGSFMVRTMLQDYPEMDIQGCIICGTGWQPEWMLSAGLAICAQVCKSEKEKQASQLLQKIAFGSYNKRVEHPRTQYDWLSRDPKIVDQYIADPLCGFVAAAGLMRDMFTGIRYIQRKDNLRKMRKDLPIYFIAGGDDPVGSYGAGVEKTVAHFENAGMQAVTSKIYPLCRHEILNEINRQEVYHDVLQWVEGVMA